MHFTVLIVGNNIEDQLAPFQENNMGTVPDKYMSFVDCNDEVEEKWNSLNATEKSSYNGISDFAEERLCLYPNNQGQFGFEDNPNSKWDWYQIGGRWAGFFKLKVVCVGKRGEKSLLDDREYPENRVDICKVGDIDFEVLPVPYAILYNGEWIESENYELENQTHNEDWIKKVSDFYNFLLKESPDALVTIVDYHN
jgi:hypothetical protein